MSRPLISVVVPLHDHAELVGEAIDSILGQSPRPLDVIVVDDGSSDGGAERVAGDPRAEIRLIRQAHAGAAVARNRGWDAARGEFITFLDADDTLGEHALARHLAALGADPSLDAVHGDVVVAGPAGEEPPTPARLPGAMLLRRRPVVEGVRFDEARRSVEVPEWVARLGDAGVRIGYVPGVALRRRVHPDNHGRATDRGEYARLMKTILDRRRGDPTIRPGRS